MDPNQSPALPIVAQQRMLSAADFKPIFDFRDALERHQLMVKFTKEIMKEGVDFGTIPGTNKPTLLKPGAERLCTFFGLCPEFITEQATEDWTGDAHRGEPFFYYRYKCILRRNGIALGEGIGSCNTHEVKYRYRWVPEKKVPSHLNKDTLETQDRTIREFAFAIEKAETSGKYGKPAEYWQRFQDAIEDGRAVKVQTTAKSGRKMDAWEIPELMYRVPNQDVADAVNTCQKMAQKRALVAAVLIAVNASEFFTQDLEDLEDFIEGTFRRVDRDNPRQPPAEEAGDLQETGGPTSNPNDIGGEDDGYRPGPMGNAPPIPPRQHAPARQTRQERAPARSATSARQSAPPPGRAGDDGGSGDEEPWTALDDADAEIAIGKIETMAGLSEFMNGLPPKARRVDTLAFKAFMKRREIFAANRS